MAQITGLGVRHSQVIMTFMCLLFSFSQRVNLSVAIVAMTDSTGSDSDIKVLPWDNAHKGVILSSMFWGYIVLQIPAGHLARTLGPKYLLFVATMVCSVATILGPYIALNYSWVMFCFSRFVLGLAQGFFFPCVNAHIAKWAPPLERNRMFSSVFIGTQVGASLTLFVAGYLAASPWGWPSIFYCTGLCGVLWSLVWLYVGADCPDSHSTISDSEREYIKSSIINSSDQSKTMPTPFWEILTSAPMWSILIANFCQLWAYWTVITMLPNYIGHVLGFDIKNNGLISSLPFLLKCVLILICGWTADLINKHGFLSLSTSKKMWNTFAMWGGAITLLGLAFVESVTAAVVLLTISVGCGAGVFTGYLSNHLDLAPNHAGLLMGITNGIGNISAILSPMVTGFLVKDETSREQWMVAFYICVATLFIGNLIFIIFGTADVQPWNEPLNPKTTPKVI